MLEEHCNKPGIVMHVFHVTVGDRASLLTILIKGMLML